MDKLDKETRPKIYYGFFWANVRLAMVLSAIYFLIKAILK
jgi:hypothetical protein